MMVLTHTFYAIREHWQDLQRVHTHTRESIERDSEHRTANAERDNRRILWKRENGLKESYSVVLEREPVINHSLVTGREREK